MAKKKACKQASGISGNLYNLIVDYLSGRNQYVEIEGQRSIEAEVRFGVPQGSLLGPRLFEGVCGIRP